MKSLWNFFTRFLKDPDVAAVAPTFDAAVPDIIEHVNINRDIVIIEYGPGDGVVSKFLLNKMTAASRFVGIETNGDFVAELQKIADPRFKILRGDARQARELLAKEGIENADYALSSIPLSFLSEEDREKLIADTALLLKPSGTFIVFQYSPLAERQLAHHFEKVERRFSFHNIPPLTILEASGSKI